MLNMAINSFSGTTVTAGNLGNVQVSDPQTNQVLLWNGSAWVNSAVSSADGGTVTSVALSGGSTGFSISNSPVTASGTMTISGTLVVGSGGTGLTTLATGRIPFGAGTSPLGSTDNLFYDSSNNRLGVLTNSPELTLHVGNSNTNLNNLALFESGDAAARISFKDSSTSDNDTVGIGALGNNLRLFSGDNPSAILDSNQNFSVGGSVRIGNTGTPVAPLHINATTSQVGFLTSTQANAYFEFFDSTTSGLNYVNVGATGDNLTFKSNNVSYRWATADGSNGQVLTTDGSGNLSFTTGSGGGGVSGTIADTQIAYGTAADTIGGDANFTWDSSRQLLEVTYSTLANVYEVVADVNITKGQAVYTTGFNGGSGKPQVDLAQSNSSSTMPAIGIAAADITAGQTGFVIIDGQLDGITTSGSANDILYVSPTVAGALTNVRPTGATELVQNMGNIIKVGAGGKIAVTTVGRTTDVPNSFSISGSMSADSLTLTTPLAIAEGGTGATTASGALSNLGAGGPSTGSANQFNVADGSGGWDSAAVYYHNTGSGGIKIGNSGLPNWPINAQASGSQSFIGRFVTQASQCKLSFMSSSSSTSAVAFGAEASQALIISNATEYLFPSSDGSSGDVMTTDGSGNLSFTDISGRSSFSVSPGTTNDQSVTIADSNVTATNTIVFSLEGNSNVSFSDDYISARNSGTSFTITFDAFNSTAASDTVYCNYMIL